MVAISRSLVAFCFIGLSAVLGAVAMHVSKDEMLDWLLLVAIILIVVLMCAGSYLCQ